MYNVNFIKIYICHKNIFINPVHGSRTVNQWFEMLTQRDASDDVDVMDPDSGIGTHVELTPWFVVAIGLLLSVVPTVVVFVGGCTVPVSPSVCVIAGSVGLVAPTVDDSVAVEPIVLMPLIGLVGFIVLLFTPTGFVVRLPVSIETTLLVVGRPVALAPADVVITLLDVMSVLCVVEEMEVTLSVFVVDTSGTTLAVVLTSGLDGVNVFTGLLTVEDSVEFFIPVTGIDVVPAV